MTSGAAGRPSFALWAVVASVVAGCAALFVAGLGVGGFLLYRVRSAPNAPVAPSQGASPPQDATQPQGAPPPVETRTPAGAVPSGLYFRIQMWGGSISQEHFYFASDGRMVWDVPAGGLDEPVMDRVAREAPASVCSYRVEGDRLLITDARGVERSLRFARVEGDDLELDGLFTSRVSAFAEARRLDGQWGASASAGVGTGASVSAAWSLRFRPDGTFESSGVGGTSLEVRGESSGASSSSASRGAYRLSGNTLVLVHEGGRETRHTAYPYGEGEQGPSPERINVDGRMYRRE